MGERCGCVSRECTCGIFQGEGLIIEGTGSEGNPHIIQVGPTATKVIGVPSSYVNVSVTGKGTASSPYAITMVKSLLSPPATPIPVVSRLTAGTSTVTKPAGCTFMEVVLIGGGAGGEYGARISGWYVGGRGGGAGGRLKTRIPVSSAEFAMTVTVGAGGSGATDGGSTSLSLADPAGAFTLAATGGKTPVTGGTGGLGSQTGQSMSTDIQPLLTDLRPGAGGRGGSERAADGPVLGTDGGKHAQYISQRINLIKNPGFTNGIGGWANRTNATVTATTGGLASPGCLLATAIASGLTEVQQSATGQNAFPVKPGQSYAYTAQMITSVAGRSLGLAIDYYNASGTLFDVHAVGGVISAGPTAWNPIAWLESSVPAGAAFARAVAYCSDLLAGEWFALDNVLVEAASAFSPYFDGDYVPSGGVNYDWMGTPGDSYSTATSENSALSVAQQGGGVGGAGGHRYDFNSGSDGQGPGAGGGGGGGHVLTGGRGGDGAAWITFY